MLKTILVGIVSVTSIICGVKIRGYYKKRADIWGELYKFALFFKEEITFNKTLLEDIFQKFDLSCELKQIKDGNYEIVSGHRRKRASELLAITKLPCIVRNISRDEAIIQMVDSNIQREEVLPSERAFAYKMKLEALKHQGKRNDLTSSQVGKKLNTYEQFAGEIGESRNQIHRYIRLTFLIPELLEMVDTKRIAFNPAYELSFLSESEQKMLLNVIDFYGQTPSVEQAREMKNLSQNYQLDEDKIDDIMSEEKGNQIPKINIPYTRVQKFLPRNVVTPKEVETFFIKCAIVCKERGINVEKLDIKIDYDEPQKSKNKDRDSR